MNKVNQSVMFSASNARLNAREILLSEEVEEATELGRDDGSPSPRALNSGRKLEPPLDADPTATCLKGVDATRGGGVMVGRTGGVEDDRGFVQPLSPVTV